MRKDTQQKQIAGRHLPPPRPTLWGLALGVLWLGLPLVLTLLLVDFVLYIAVTGIFGRCYGLFCLVG